MFSDTFTHLIFSDTYDIKLVHTEHISYNSQALF